MDRWDQIIKSKVGKSQPYRPEPKWDKMAAMLDEELPVTPIPAPGRRSNFGRIAWAASFLLIGFTAATLLWWSLDVKPNQQKLWVEEMQPIEEADCEEEGLTPQKRQEFKISPNQSPEAPAKVQTKTLRLLIPTPKLTTEKIEEDTPLVSPQGKYRGVTLAEIVREAEVRENLATIPVIGKVDQFLLAEEAETRTYSAIEEELESETAPHIVMPVVPDKKVRVGKANINLSKAKREIGRYASISKDAVSLALGPGVKKKWARHKWGVEFQLSLNHLPKRKAYYSIDGETFDYSYTPINPGVVLNLHRRLSPRWEVGLSGGVDGIWFPLEATPGDVNDYTEIWGTGYDVSVFGKRHLRKNPEKRFRPYLIGSAGTYIMDLGLGRFQEFGTLEENPSNWAARRKAPEEANQQFTFEYESYPVKYSYLTGSFGTGINIRLYRRLSLNYQVALSGNVLIHEKVDPDIAEYEYWGFNHQWKQAMGVAMSF
jgi:hypothetical protein